MTARILVIVLLAALTAACSNPAAQTLQQGELPSSGAVGVDASSATVASDPASPSPSAPARTFSVARVGPWVRAAILEKNWHPGCPVPVRDLRLLRITYLGFDGNVHSGPMVVNERVASDVLWVFHRLFEAGFPIKRIAMAGRYRPNHDYYGSVRNVTAAFNCRPVTENPGSLSQHSYGWAVDVNPLENPYVRADGSVLRKAAEPYTDRAQHVPGMIHPDDLIVRLFTKIGFGWGGNWSTIKDYMHFSLTGT